MTVVASLACRMWRPLFERSEFGRRDRPLALSLRTPPKGNGAERNRGEGPGHGTGWPSGERPRAANEFCRTWVKHRQRLGLFNKQTGASANVGKDKPPMGEKTSGASLLLVALMRGEPGE